MTAKPSMLSTPIASPAVIFEGLKLLGHTDIRWLVIIPTLLNLILFSAATWLANQVAAENSIRLSNVGIITSQRISVCPRSFNPSKITAGLAMGVLSIDGFAVIIARFLGS